MAIERIRFQPKERQILVPRFSPKTAKDIMEREATRAILLGWANKKKVERMHPGREYNLSSPSRLRATDISLFVTSEGKGELDFHTAGWIQDMYAAFGYAQAFDREIAQIPEDFKFWPVTSQRLGSRIVELWGVVYHIDANYSDEVEYARRPR